MCGVPLLVALALVSLGVCANGDDDTYLIGAGRYDVTGPAAEIEMVCVHCDLCVLCMYLSLVY